MSKLSLDLMINEKQIVIDLPAPVFSFLSLSISFTFFVKIQSSTSFWAISLAEMSASHMGH